MAVFSSEERAALLALARQALEARVRRGTLPPVPRGGAYDLACGAFVSIHRVRASLAGLERRERELRGCLGRLEPRPLSETIVHLAAVVSDSDPRFDPVRVTELHEIHVEISVLTPERVVASVEEIEIGRHGLIAEHGYRRGLLLPQVPVEHGWDRDTFLEHTCLKAGLPRDAWRRDARLLVFEAEVFGESERSD